MGFRLLVGDPTAVSPEEVRHVQLRVCGAAKDVAEARQMLDFLGLLPTAEDKSDKPEYYELCMRQKHRLTPENTVFGDRGGRKCKACRDAREPTPVSDDAELCANRLHYMTSDNTKAIVTRGKPGRRCVACHEEANRRHAAKRRDSGRTTVELRGKVCVNGHLWTDGSFTLTKAGSRSCLVCKA